MSQIGVGINENVIIAKTTINEKERLVIELVSAEKAGTKKVSVFDTMMTAGVQNESSGGLQLQLFGPLLPTKEDLTQERKVDMLGADIVRLRNQLTQILQQFTTDDQIDLHTMEVMLNGTGITDGATYEKRILDQDVLNKIYKNLSTRFVELMKPYLATPEPVRFKLTRQSKDKHYATIPSRYIADQPFIEPMSVPKEQSKVKFSKYELDNGLDNGTPIKQEGNAEAKQNETAAATPALETNPFAPQ